MDWVVWVVTKRLITRRVIIRRVITNKQGNTAYALRAGQWDRFADGRLQIRREPDLSIAVSCYAP